MSAIHYARGIALFGMEHGVFLAHSTQREDYILRTLLRHGVLRMVRCGLQWEFKYKRLYTYMLNDAIHSGGSRGGSMGSMDPPFFKVAMFFYAVCT